MPKFKKILLVEDDYITIVLCERILKIAEFAEEVISVVNGREAYTYLDLAKNNLPEIILLDLNMPVMSGWEFLEKYEDWMASVPANSFLPVIYILTSSVDPDEKERALAYSFVRSFISKPLSREHLYEIN